MTRIAALCCVVAVVLAGCSLPVSLDEYVVDVSDLADSYIIETQNLSSEYQGSVEDGVRDIVASGVDDPQVPATSFVIERTTEYLALVGDAMDRYRLALDEIVPPDEIEEAHRSYVVAVGIVHGTIPATRDAVEAADDIAGIQVALASSGFSDGQIRWTAACVALEETVRENGSGIDLGCVRPGVGG